MIKPYKAEIIPAKLNALTALGLKGVHWTPRP